MPAHKKEFDARCTDCKGTGLYVGFAENDGIAVVCRTCKGTGAVHRVVTWDDAPCTPILRPDVSWVIEANPGFINLDASSSSGGMSYESWRAGNIFVRGMEPRQLVCPHWWYQTARRDNYPYSGEWCSPRGSFAACEHFPYKATCWARYDREEGKA